MLKERLLKYWNDHHQAITKLLIAFLFALLGLGGAYELGTRNPDASLLARPTAVKATATPRPARPTSTPPGITLSPTASPVPPATATLTSTPGEPTPTPTSIVVGHDITLWHAPGVAGHQHGLDPQAAHPAIVEWLNTHPWGPLFSSIGHPWASSPVENLYPWPLGKHEGHVNLGELATGCDQFNPGGDFQHGNCIESYLFQIHALGNAHEFRARFHSEKIVAWVCDKAGEKCGIVATGGLADFGEAHAAYKKELCPLADNPPFDESATVNQPPYRTVNGSKRFFLFWSTLTNVSVEKFFDPVPNRLFQSAWNNRPFSVPSLEDCTDPSLDISHTNPENRNNVFQVFSLLLYIDQFPRPFEGYTDIHGNLSESCTAPSMVCVPLYIGADVPAGNATLNRPVMHGDPEAAPVQVYGADATLLPPGGMEP